MTDISRRNFLKGVAAGAGLALATGVGGIVPVEAAAPPRAVGTGYADFLVHSDGEMRLVGQLLSVEIERRIEEMARDSPYREFASGFITPGHFRAQLIYDHVGARILEDWLTEGLDREIEMVFALNDDVQRMSLRALACRIEITVEHDIMMADVDIRAAGPVTFS